MKANELQEKSVEELNAALLEQLQEQFKLLMQSSTGQLTQTHLMKEARKNIARIKTVINQKAGK